MSLNVKPFVSKPWITVVWPLTGRIVGTERLFPVIILYLSQIKFPILSWTDFFVNTVNKQTNAPFLKQSLINRNAIWKQKKCLLLAHIHLYYALPCPLLKLTQRWEAWIHSPPSVTPWALELSACYNKSKFSWLDWTVDQVTFCLEALMVTAGIPWVLTTTSSLTSYHCFANLMNGSIGNNRVKAY